MNPKSMLLMISLFLLGLSSFAQYTEKINSNRPGTSQGAFSVGNNVLQLEGGFGLGKQKHELLDTRTNVFNFDYDIRYGLLIEQLEIRFNGRYRSDGVRRTVGAGEQKIRQSNFEYNTIGAKYLIYDPYKKPKKDSINLNSWKDQHRFKWKSLIPAVSAYLGANFISKDNPFTAIGDEGISPKIVVMTQNNWYNSNAGSWVLVTNLIYDKITTDDPVLGWFITTTHTINDNWAVFGEYQGQKSDFYSDNILRLGGAYLFGNDLQIDANIATNFKDTPSVFKVSFGASYRFDWHKKDEIIELPGFEKGIQEDEEDENKEEGEENEDEEFDEFEESESDSLKLRKTPFVNEFEDPSHREAMEQDLDERRTAERLERERIEQEKVDKKNSKKFKKEEQRRLKREAKEAKKAEQAKIKAEKEKQKMIDEIDAELNKIEKDDDLDDELKSLDEELKKLEGEIELEDDAKKNKKKAKKEKKPKKKEKEVDDPVDDVDAEYEKLQKEKEEEEKRRKKAEKKRQKEEKKRRKKEKKETSDDNGE